MKKKIMDLVIFLTVLMATQSVISGALDNGPEIIGSDPEKRIVATYEGIERDNEGRFESFLINLTNVTNHPYELYIEPMQVYRGAVYLLDPKNMSTSSLPTIGSIFAEDFREDHNRPPPEKLTRIEPGETLEYNFTFGDYVDFSALDQIEKVNIMVRASLYMFEKGADYNEDHPAGIIAIFKTLTDVSVNELPNN